MADNNVFITGTAEGAFAEAFNGIPPWASQKTAEDIEKVLKDLLKVETAALANAIKCCKGAGGDGSADTKKVTEELEKLGKATRLLNEEEEKRRKLRKKDDKDDAERRADNRRNRESSFSLNKALSGLAGVSSLIVGVQKQYFETSHDLFKSGINLIDGQSAATTSMQSLNQIVTLTGMRLETFRKVVQEYSSSINSVGVNKFAKTISLTTSRLIELGYSTEQQAELIGTLIESESSYSDIRSKTQQQLADDAVRLGKQMTRLSVLTGQSSEKLQENLRSLAKNTDSTVVAAVYGEKAAERMNTFASSFKDAEVGQMFQKLAASTQPSITKSFQALAMAGQAPLAEEFTRIAKAARDGTMTAEEAQKATTAMAQRVNGTTIQSLALLADKGVEGAAETLSVISKLRAQGNQTSKATGEQVDAAVESQAALSRFSSELEKTRSLAQQAFPLLETQVNLASAALAVFNQTVTAATNVFSAETRSWIAVGLQAASALASIAIYARDSGMGLLKFGGQLLAIGGAFAAGYAVGGIIYDVISNFEWFNNMMDSIFHGLDILLDSIPGLGKISGASDRLATREKLEAMNGGSPSKSTISVPKAPAMSTITSPSAVPAGPAKPDATSANNGVPHPTPAAAATQPRSAPGDINSTLTYQTTLLTQLLESTQSLVSVNREILKYSKVHS